jgi:Skp family chaperone for outer membrane proteins
LDAVKKATGEVAKAKGYAHVIDNSTGSVVWSANAADDLTGAVIAAMLKK